MNGAYKIVSIFLILSSFELSNIYGKTLLEKDVAALESVGK